MIRDGELCGYIFARVGKGITWGYMVPIEPVFDAIYEHLRNHFKSIGYPEIPKDNGISGTNSNGSPLSNTKEALLHERADQSKAHDVFVSLPSVNSNSDAIAKREVRLPGGRQVDEPWNRAEVIPRALSYPSRPQEGVPNPHGGQKSSQGGTPLRKSGATRNSYSGNAIHSSGSSMR